MPRIDVYFSLGTNMGDREAILGDALSLMDETFGTSRAAVSEIIETQAWGFEGAPFLNLAVKYSLPRSRKPIETEAIDILHKVKSIEHRMGRSDAPEYDANGQRIYHDRIIDIDILFVGKHIIRTAELTVPHPLIAQRDFVKIPLRQIASPSLRASFPALFEL